MKSAIVVFRRFPDGDIIALFACLPADSLDARLCQSYMPIGQYGAADPGIVYDTRPAKPHEYAALQAELEQRGYRLAIRRPCPGDAYARRQAAITAPCPSLPPVKRGSG